MSKKINRVGEFHRNNEGYLVNIIECYGAKKCVVRFEDGHTQLHTYNSILKGTIKNLHHRTIFGVGYFGIGKYKSSVGKVRTKVYEYWINMLNRCYNTKFHEKYPTYKEVTLCEEWECFQNFAQWYEINFKSYMKGWHLDKDLFSKDCKIYSPDTCCFIPNEINQVLILSESCGIYRKADKFVSRLTKNSICEYLGLYTTKEEATNVSTTAKKEWIQELADKWKPLLNINVYNKIKTY